VSEVGEKRKTFSGGERSKSFWKEKVFLAEGRSETLAANYSGRRERREEREKEKKKYAQQKDSDTEQKKTFSNFVEKRRGERK
jgi:hypothetical protein